MTAAGAIAVGLRRALRHPGVVLWNWLVPLLPAALLTAMMSAGIAGVYDHAPSASRVLRGDWSGPWGEFLSGAGDRVLPVLAGTFVLLVGLAVALRIAVSAGTVEVLLERPDAADKPFWTGIGTHLGRFLRSAVWFGLAMLPALVGGTIVFRAFRGLAESRMDGRLDLWAAAAAAATLLLLALPALLAYDFGRIAVAFHRHGRTLRAFLAGVRWTARRAGRLAVVYAAFTAAAVLVPVAWLAARGGWSPATTPGVVALLAAGQIAMLARAFLRVAFLGAEIAIYEAEGEPGFGAPVQAVPPPARAVGLAGPARTPPAHDFQI